MTIRFYDFSVQMAAGLDKRACPVVVRDLRNTDRSFSLYIMAVNTVGDKSQNSRSLSSKRGREFCFCGILCQQARAGDIFIHFYGFCFRYSFILWYCSLVREIFPL